jgi:hypothetical protein
MYALDVLRDTTERIERDCANEVRIGHQVVFTSDSDRIFTFDPRSVSSALVHCETNTTWPPPAYGEGEPEVHPSFTAWGWPSTTRGSSRTWFKCHTLKTMVRLVTAASFICT